MPKYPINKEFFPFNHFAPPISEGFLKIAAKHMGVPRKFLKAKGFNITKHKAKSYDGAEIYYFVISPEKLKEPAPCLFYIHGGGYVLKAAGYHYMNCLRYAKEAGCKVIFPDYRLAPDYPFPVFYEDCYGVFDDVFNNAEAFGIDRDYIGLGGDSAGAALAAGLCLMASERNHSVRFRYLMLPYPFLDARNNSESCRKFIDTPMWNSKLSERIGPMTRVDKSHPSYTWYSPVETRDFSVFPPAYIETAEFDCLHDDGILFAECLRNAGVPVELNETRGIMHGYDIMTKASISLDSMHRRIEFIKSRLTVSAG